MTVRVRIAEQLRRPVDDVSLDDRVADLVTDSIDMIEVAIDLQEELDVWFDERDFGQVVTVRDLVELITSRLGLGASPVPR